MSHRGDVQPCVERDAAIQNYLPLVKFVISRLAPTLPPSLDREDLFSCGVIGLMEALERFDAGRGVKFETYAITRIRGSIIDAIRATDHLSRTSRQNARRIDQAMSVLTHRLGRLPNRHEMAVELDVPVAHYDAMVREASWATVSLDAPLFEAVDVGDAVPCDPSDWDFDASIVRRESLQALSQALTTIPQRELLVLSLYYTEGLTMREIAGVLDVSGTRVCQIHARAIERLRERLATEAAA
jgi:RNA polymerase sigma factor for flagellar operon FliA